MQAFAMTVALLSATPQEGVERRPVLQETTEDATPNAYAFHGGWRVWVRELEPTERERMSAARLVPWQVVRCAGKSEPEVVLDSKGTWPRPSWIRPRHLEIDASGCVYAVLEERARLLVSSAESGSLVEHELPAGEGLEVAHLEPEGLLRATKGRREARAAWWYALGPLGLGEARPMPPIMPAPQGVEPVFLRAGNELVWCSSEDSLAVLDLSTGAVRSLACPDANVLLLERSAGDWLFARAVGPSQRLFTGELRLTNLTTGVAFSRPAYEGLVAWTPAGNFHPRWFQDPITNERHEIGEPLSAHGDCRQVDDHAVAFRPHARAAWRVLHLEATTPYPMPSPSSTAKVLQAALDDPGRPETLALQSTEFFQAIDGLGETRSAEAIDLLARILRSDAGINAKLRAAGRLAWSGHAGAREPLRVALLAEPEPTLRVNYARHLASFGRPEDARAIEEALPVTSLPPGTGHGDAAVRVAEALAMIGDEGSVEYLEALYERAPFDKVQRALDSVRDAPRFRAALLEARRR